ncbi:MAG: hypothetical protein DME38_08615 [Verrucomicrobia bacterium]|nr:MAG: hypothetical protein DME38_08615 [Verrucomicrobiota bacterium]
MTGELRRPPHCTQQRERSENSETPQGEIASSEKTAVRANEQRKGNGKCLVLKILRDVGDCRHLREVDDGAFVPP